MRLMDAEHFPHLAPSAEAVERLRSLILTRYGITVEPERALRIGTFLIQASILLAEPSRRDEPEGRSTTKS